MRIVIDPGHGGRDPGAVGLQGLQEKEVVLDIATRLVRLLRGENLEVELTRAGDYWLSLANRADITRRFGATVFLSLHCNAAVNRGVHGTETFHWDGNQLAITLARSVNQAIVRGMNWRDRRVRPTLKFGVLRRLPGIAAVLIEYNFISHPDVERKLVDPYVRGQLAEFTKEGVLFYVASLPERS